MLMVHSPFCNPVSNSSIAERGGAAFEKRTVELMRAHRETRDRLYRETRKEEFPEKLAPLQAKLTEDVTQVAREEGVLGGKVGHIIV